MCLLHYAIFKLQTDLNVFLTRYNIFLQHMWNLYQRNVEKFLGILKPFERKH